MPQSGAAPHDQEKDTTVWYVSTTEPPVASSTGCEIRRTSGLATPTVVDRRDDRNCNAVPREEQPGASTPSNAAQPSRSRRPTASGDNPQPILNSRHPPFLTLWIRPLWGHSSSLGMGGGSATTRFRNRPNDRSLLLPWDRDDAPDSPPPMNPSPPSFPRSARFARAALLLPRR